MRHYYEKKLASVRLKQVYDLATPRIRQYLKAELDYAVSHIRTGDLLLDLGCGYGRQFPELCRKAGFVVGIDSSEESLSLGREFLKEVSNYLFVRMDVAKLEFPDESFDVVTCLQNGISAFHTDPQNLIREAVRVTKTGGTILFSSYSGKFWNERLRWFELQAGAGLLGRIDYRRTRNGRIVCHDGFTATTADAKRFIEWTKGVSGIQISVTEVDDSSIFLTIIRS